MTDDQLHKAGNLLADTLNLRRSKEHKDRWLTSWGDKTGLGVYLTVQAMLAECEKQATNDS